MFPLIDKEATGKRLRVLMKEKKVSARQLQDYLGLACVQSIYHWLDGTSMPTIDNLYAMSELFGMPIDGLVRGNRESSFPETCGACARKDIRACEQLQKAA